MLIKMFTDKVFRSGKTNKTPETPVKTVTKNPSKINNKQTTKIAENPHKTVFKRNKLKRMERNK